MTVRYLLHTKKCDFSAVARTLQVEPVVVRVMLNRGIPEEQMGEFLYPECGRLHDPALLPDALYGARLLAECIRGGKKIRIIGDYDVDGVCSTCILLLGLKKLGADADYAVPERERHGYGLHEELIDLALSDGRQVLLTCDNGISEIASIRRAKEAGMTVIVTDHHNVPDQLPPADAVIDPKRTAADGMPSYPYPDICGAVVAMKFLQLLYAECGRSAAEPLRDFMDLAAFATVCDVMPLLDENRVIVYKGLRAVSHTGNRGLRALMQTCEVRSVKAWHFGFVLGPCVNAAGRLQTAQEAMKLLLAQTDGEANAQAAYLKELNESRKYLTQQAAEEAVRQIEETGKTRDRVLVLHLPECPDSIAGIVSGRIRDRYSRPAFVVTGKGEILKGSARSVEGYSLFDEMSKIKDVFVRYGGHALAAGFSVRADRLEEMRRQLNEGCTLRLEDLCPKKYIDADMPMSHVSFALMEQLSLLEPYGTGHEEPLFAESACIIRHASRIGREGQYLRVRLAARDGFETEAVYFGSADAFLKSYREKFGIREEESLLRAEGSCPLSLTYRPKINEFRGKERIEYRVEDFIF